MKMRIWIFLLFFALLPMWLQANTSPKPEKIYSITQVLKPLAYYQEQAGLWKEVIDRTPVNADAWLNYYAACRMANLRTYTKEKPFDLDSIIEQLSAKIPNTFEYHHAMSWHGQHNEATFQHALRAYELAPDRPETYPHLLVFYELNGNKEAAATILQKWFDSGKYSPGILAWNYNMLMSLEQDAILLTSGDNDTYPAWILQAVQKVRPDVKVWNINLIAKKQDYLKRLFQESDLPNFDRLPEEYPKPEFYFNALTRHLLDSADQPVYLGVATSRTLRELYSENLYMVGLAFRYSTRPFDNIAVLKHNFEQKFLTDYLNIELYNDFSETVVNQMNLNYIPPFIVLHKHYTTSGELQKADDLKNLTLNIARKGGQEESVRVYLGEEKKPKSPIESVISVKKLDKAMMKIRGNLWAAQTELTNESYENFLIDLVKNKAFDQLAICQPGKTDWRALVNKKFNKTPRSAVFVSTRDSGDFQKTIDDFDNVPDNILFENGHPDDEELPIQNISYEAATLYCKWITEVYNNTNSKKKKFQKVIFRLPTEEEWEFAARGKQKSGLFPWGGYYVRNDKGCYLSNFDVSEMAPCKDCKNKAVANDGGFFSVTADAYFPNDYGLYGCSGNIAEMVAEKGVSKGGSWEDKPKDCQIESQKLYTKPSPAIGFRVFMEVVKQ